VEMEDLLTLIMYSYKFINILLSKCIMSKNIRNTNRYVINIDASLNDTAIATYSNSGLIPVTWNPPNI